jgi:hypothetical protein
MAEVEGAQNGVYIGFDIYLISAVSLTLEDNVYSEKGWRYIKENLPPRFVLEALWVEYIKDIRSTRRPPRRS